LLRSPMVVHFSISGQRCWRRARSFTPDIVGLKHLATGRAPRHDGVFPRAAGVCVILVKRDPPINPGWRQPWRSASLVWHRAREYPAALRPFAAKAGVGITFEEDRQGGVIQWPARLFPRSRRNGAGIHRPASYAGYRGHSGLWRRPLARARALRKKIRIKRLESLRFASQNRWITGGG